MTTTKLGARDILFALAKAAWDDACADLTATPQKVLYQGKIEDVPVAGTYWARLSMLSVMEAQANLGTQPQDDGSVQRRRTAKGIFTVQMFAPHSKKGSEAKLQAVAERVKNALAASNSSGTVWLRNARTNDLVPDDTNHRLNVVAEYEYDEIV